MITNLWKNFNEKRETWIFWMIATAGLLLRLEYLREFANEVYCSVALGADVQEYCERAQEILQGVIFPRQAEIHAPLYSFFLALICNFTNSSILAVRFIQLFLNWGAYIMLARQIKKFGGTEKQQFIFLAFAMFVPVIFYHQAELVSESLLAPLLVIFLEFMLRSKEKRFALAGAGMALGGMILTHGLMLGFAVGEVVYFAWRKRFRECGILIAGMAIVLLPVIAAKSWYYGKFTGIQDNGAYNFWIGNNPDATGGCYLRPGRAWSAPLESARCEAAERQISVSRVFLEKSFGFMVEHPGKALLNFGKKFLLLSAPSEPIAGADPEILIRRTAIQKYGAWMMTVVLIFAWCGVYFAIRKVEGRFVHFYILAGATALCLILTVVAGRYRQGLMPGILLLATLGVCYLGKKGYIAAVCGVVIGCFAAFQFSGNGMYDAASIEGEAYFLNGDLSVAKSKLLLAETGLVHPERFDNMLGAIAESEGDLTEAENRYIRVISLAPDDPDGWLNLAHLYFTYYPGERGLALGLIEEALKRETALPSAYDMLGMDFARQGRIREALEMFETALGYEPTNELYQKKVNSCRQIIARGGK